MASADDLTCNACRMAPYPADAPRVPETGLPSGWVVRRINGRTFTLCDCCGDIRHFKGAISSYLQEALGLPEYARCEFDDQAGSGLHRTRNRT